jgi:hypothetical protein
MSDKDGMKDTPITPPSATDTTQKLSEKPGYPSTTRAPKVENRPLDVKGKGNKKRVKARKPGESFEMPDNPSLPPLSIKQSLFVKALTDPSSPTYGNQTESYRRVYGQHLNDNIAAVHGHRLVRHSKVTGWIEEILRKAGCSTRARVAELALVMTGQAPPQRIVRTITSPKGKVTKIVEHRGVSGNDKLKAIDQLNKLSGDYAKAQTAGNRIANDEYDSLIKRTVSKVKQRTVKHDDSKVIADGGTGAKTGEGD